MRSAMCVRWRESVRWGLISVLVVQALMWAAPAAGVDGTTEACDDFQLDLAPIVSDIIALIPGLDIRIDIADEGWVWIAPSTDKFRSVTGVVTRTHVADNDLPANHATHDHNTVVLVDPAYADMVSPVNDPGQMHVEWETGIRPSEHTGDGDHPIFPKWAWPSAGDRVWFDGHFIYDCGHPSGGLYRSEIHPPRAVAAMRNQTGTLPGSGTTPVPVTAVDLYVHGRGGYVLEQLNCGMGIILDLDPTPCAVRTTPIALDLGFDVCVPPKPFDSATLVWTIEDGPGNTIAIEPDVDEVDVPADHPCRLSDPMHTTDFDDLKMLHVALPLEGSGAADDDVYARRITTGWVFPPNPALRHFAVSLEHMDLHEDHDPIPIEPPTTAGEMSFFWMGVEGAANEWERLSDWDSPTSQDCQFPCGNHENEMGSYDDDHDCCFGDLNFNGPTFDLYVRNLGEFNLRTFGYDQDCLEFWFGIPFYTTLAYADCYVITGPITFEPGRSDAVASYHAVFGPDDYELVVVDDSDGEYDLTFATEELALTDEDTSGLAVTKTCTHDGEVPLAGEPLDCTIEVTNAGPGLPRDTRVSDEVTGAGGPLDYSVASPTFRFASDADPFDCEIIPTNEFECNLGTVPVGGTATIDVEVTAGVPGTLTNTAFVETLSTDTDPDDNEASATLDVFLGVDVDVRPDRDTAIVVLSNQQKVVVTVLTTPDFDATTIDPASVRFGDAEAPAERSSREVHGRGHFEDVDKDRDRDLVMHFLVSETGIDLGDPEACLIGSITEGIGIYGCDVIRTR